MKMSGVGLIEVMLSALLSCLLIIILSRYVIETQKTYQHSRTILNTAWDKQWVTAFIQDRIQRAGFTPCIGLNHLQPLLPSVSISAAKMGPVLQLRRMSDTFFDISDMAQRQHLGLSKKGDMWLKALPASTPLLIANCFRAVIRERQLDVKPTEIVLTKPIPINFTQPVYLGTFIEESFYAGKNQHGESVLFYRHIHPEVLMTGIQTFRVKALDQRHIRITITLDNQLKPWTIDGFIRTP